MTEQQFVAWVDEDVRAEWVDGEVIIMPPDNFEHAKLGLWLLWLVEAFSSANDLGEVVGPNFMVRFASLRRRRLPDVLFISKSRIDLIQANHLEGAPDLIMEVVSPDSESRDWREKYDDYRKAGVREYWVIDPMSQHVEAYTLTRGKAYRRIDEIDGVIRSKVLRGLYIKASWLWKETRPSVLVALRELGVK